MRRSNEHHADGREARQNSDGTTAQPRRELLTNHNDCQRVFSSEEKAGKKLVNRELDLAGDKSREGIEDREPDNSEHHQSPPTPPIGKKQKEERRDDSQACEPEDNAPLG